ncbi:MAG TPA: ATP-binding protein [Dinghuibacter sp.]|uniref:sensor histidine kinase n=1 Tax=Dinghuibacter sp. TaxID=2024697 RepID=UPI002CDA0471|nr:ATP-binding protein [Dinghuibacter sp.]HTJ12997.1 ATP-binding protein [Dinghuibacter sp.]
MQDNYQEVATVVIISGLLFFALTGILVFILLFYQKRRFQHARKLVEMERTYTEAQLEIQEQTSRSISQEIHDNIGQVLSFVKLNLNTLDLHGGEKDEEKLQQSRTLLTRAIQDLRDIARTLDTDSIKEAGIAGAIGQQLTLLTKTGAYRTTLEETGVAYRLDLQRELVAFRVVQELLNNIVKHAGATEIDVQVRYRPDELAVEVRDNGQGFSLAHAQPGKGLGLRNMVNRVTQIRGTLSIAPVSATGTLALIILPNP